MIGAQKPHVRFLRPVCALAVGLRWWVDGLNGSTAAVGVERAPVESDGHRTLTLIAAS